VVQLSSNNILLCNLNHILNHYDLSPLPPKTAQIALLSRSNIIDTIVLYNNIVVRRSTSHTAVEGQHRSPKTMRNGRGGGGRIPFGHRDTDVYGGWPGFEHGHRAKDDPGRAG